MANVNVWNPGTGDVGNEPNANIKSPVEASTLANITLSGIQTIDSVPLLSGDRVLVRNQTIPAENGIYQVSFTDWTRVTDFNDSDEVLRGTLVLDSNSGVFYRAVFADTVWTPDVSEITFLPTTLDSDATAITYTPTGATETTVSAELDKTSKTYPTLAALIADEAYLTINKSYYITERTEGNGGGEVWKYVGGGIPDTYSIVAGAGINTFQLQVVNVVNVRQFGAKCNGESASAAISAAVQYAVDNNLKVYIPAGEYTLDSAITPPVVPDTDPSGRRHSIPIVGDGKWNTILNYTGTGYAIDFQTNATPAGGGSYIDGYFLKGFQIKTSTGGGIAFASGGDVKVDDFFMNGCASGYWGIFADGSYNGGVGIYNINISNSRLWNNSTDYAGGFIYCNNFFSCHVNNNFMSQSTKDGDLNFFSRGRILIVDGGNMVEAAINASVTSQVAIAIGGSGVFDSIQNTNIVDLHTEGYINTIVRLGSTRQFNVTLKNINTGFLAGNPDVKILDASTNPLHKNIQADGLYYFSADTNASADFIVDDPYHLVKLTNYFNGSVGNQASKAWSQSGDIQEEVPIRFGRQADGIIRKHGTANLPTETFYKWSGTGDNYYATRKQVDSSGNLKHGIAAASAEIDAETIVDVFGIDRAWQAMQFLNNEGVGSGSASLGSNSPATVPSAPYTWIRVLAPDGTVCFLPIWK